MKVDGLGGGMMRGSGRGRRFSLDLLSSSRPGSLSPSWRGRGREAVRSDTEVFFGKKITRIKQLHIIIL